MLKHFVLLKIDMLKTQLFYQSPALSVFINNPESLISLNPKCHTGPGDKLVLGYVMCNVFKVLFEEALAQILILTLKYTLKLINMAIIRINIDCV